MSQVYFKKVSTPAIVLIIIIGIFYALILSNSLIWDSNPLIKSNLFLKNKLPAYKVFSKGYWESSGREINKDYYRPVVILSFIIENKLWKTNALKLKIFNILYFMLSLFLLYKFLYSETKNQELSLIFITLFSLFTLNLDNVLWVAGRCDIFLLLFFVLSIYFFAKYLKTGIKWFFLISNLFFILGLFSKESFVIFFFILLVYDLIKSKKPNYLFHLINIFSITIFIIIRNSVVIKSGINFVNNGNIILTSIAVLGYYFKSLIFPFKYSMFLPVTDILNLNYYVFGILFIISYLIVFALIIKKKIYDIHLFMFFLFNSFIGLYLLFSFSSVFPFSISTRYMMIPLIGFVFLISLLIIKLKKSIRYILLGSLILIFISVNILNSRNYESDIDFWSSNLKNSPENSFINYSYAYQLFLNKRFLKADKYLEKALKYRLDMNTAFSIGILKAEIELKKCNLNQALKWLNTIKNLRVRKNKQLYFKDVYLKILKNKKIANYVYENYKSGNSIKDELAYLKALHCLNKSDEIKEFLNNFFKKYGNNKKTYNTLGLFYLNNVLNKKRAINFFNKSLKIDKNQNKIKRIIKDLKDE